VDWNIDAISGDMDILRAGAYPGFGPLIYDSAIYFASQYGARRLFPSTERTLAARKFWAKQGKKEQILPLSRAAFTQKYGGSLEDAIMRGKVRTFERAKNEKGEQTDKPSLSEENGFWAVLYAFSQLATYIADDTHTIPGRALTPRQSARIWPVREEERKRRPRKLAAVLYTYRLGKRKGLTDAILFEFSGDTPLGVSDIAALGTYRAQNFEGGRFWGDDPWCPLLRDLALVRERKLRPDVFRMRHGIDAGPILAEGARFEKGLSQHMYPDIFRVWKDIPDFRKVEPTITQGGTGPEAWEVAALGSGLPQMPPPVVAPRRRLVRPNPRRDRTRAEKTLDVTRTGHTVTKVGAFAAKKAAPKLAARAAATTAGRFGARAVPIVGEVLMVAGAGKEAYKVGKRRAKEGWRSGSVTRDVAKVTAGAFGLEDFVPEAKTNPTGRKKRTSTGRTVLFVDMDETLLHSSTSPLLGPNVHRFRADGVSYWTALRSDAEMALGAARELFDDVYLFTAAEQDYAHAALDVTGLRGYFDAVYTANTPRSDLPDVSDARWVLIDDSAEISSWKLTDLGLRPAQFGDHWQPIRAYRGARSDDYALPEAVLFAFERASRQEE
jgi:hypothetical protein